MAIEVREHAPGKDLRDFVQAGRVVFAGDPAWVAPLDFELKERLTPGKNPFFTRAEATLFTAWQDGVLVGRCSAQIDREHVKLYNDSTGFFGFFDTIDDDAVGAALLDAAAKWLGQRGMTRMRGPMSLYINEEVGVLVEGFDTPPMLSMAHSRAWQGRVAESAGLTKAKDLLAWKYDILETPKRAQRALADIQKLPEVKLRSVDTRNMARELDIIMDIYNDAWGDKWGVVPALPDEVAKVAQDMKLIIDPDLAFIAEIDGRAMGMCIMLPNLNEAIHDLDGRLFPFGWAKLLWRLKVKHPVSARLMMLGIRKELRMVRKYGALSVAMYAEVARRGHAKGYRWAELSWTREDDGPINAGIRAMGGAVYKKYRVYERAIPG